MSVPDDHRITLREYVNGRLDNLAQAITREVMAVRSIMGEHTEAHAREHGMHKDAIDKAYQAIDQRINSEHAATQAQFDELRRAVDKAERYQVEKFASVNEFRQVLSDQGATFVTRDFVDQMKESLEKAAAATEDQLRAELERSRVKIETLEKEARFAEGRYLGITLAIGAVVTVLSLALRFLPFGGG